MSRFPFPSPMRSQGQYVVVFLLFLTVQAIALLFAPMLYDLSLQAFEDPGDPLNPLYYVAAMIVMTAIILVVLKFTKGNALRYIFFGAVFMTLYAVFLPLTLYMTDERAARGPAAHIARPGAGPAAVESPGMVHHRSGRLHRGIRRDGHPRGIVRDLARSSSSSSSWPSTTPSRCTRPSTC